MAAVQGHYWGDLPTKDPCQIHIHDDSDQLAPELGD
jgi:hypothetical protein